ncbi:Vacuolar fusion protein mon1, variant 3 [Basidiobolus ranarum]|uniref:Vacuolar fusion protein MON1 n=1 Tax=Basidiobolus ranarum TaxID=34480 RepID=A0ABR2X230_9FUNG
MDSSDIPKPFREGNELLTSASPISSSPILTGKFNTFKSKPSVHLSVDNTLPSRPSSPSASSNLSSYSTISKLSGDIMLDGASFRSRESEDIEYMLRIGPTSPKRKSGLGIELGRDSFVGVVEDDLSSLEEIVDQGISGSPSLSSESRESKSISKEGYEEEFPELADINGEELGGCSKKQSKYRKSYAEEDPYSPNWAGHEKHFFILSSAGKPIYSRFGDESKLSSYMGVIQAIVSFFADTGDSIKSISAGEHKFVFLLRSPLYLLAVAKTGEPESHIRTQLMYLYNQVLSIVTLTQLTRIFEQRVNFDLRRLLSGTETFLDSLCREITYDPSIMLGAIHALKLRKSLRTKFNNSLQLIKSKHVLFAMLITSGKLVTLLRPRKQSLHPSDLHLVFNMVNGSTTFHSGESWTPICLPRFNSKGFLHAYVCFIAKETCLVMISPDKDMFFECSASRDIVVEHLNQTEALVEMEQSVDSKEYTLGRIGVAFRLMSLHGFLILC